MRSMSLMISCSEERKGQQGRLCALFHPVQGMHSYLQVLCCFRLQRRREAVKRCHVPVVLGNEPTQAPTIVHCLSSSQAIQIITGRCAGYLELSRSGLSPDSRARIMILSSAKAFLVTERDSSSGCAIKRCGLTYVCEVPYVMHLRGG